MVRCAVSKIRRVDYSPDEMLAGVCGDMSPVEFGVYWMVCTLIYSRGEAIKDDVSWIARKFKSTNPRTVRAAIDSLIAMKKIERIGGELMVNRCRTELEASVNRVRTAGENGSKGGRKRRERAHVSNEINGNQKPGGFLPPNPTHELTINHQPSTNNIEEDTSVSPSMILVTPTGDLLGEVLPPKRGKPRSKSAKGFTMIRADWAPDTKDVDHAKSKGNSDEQITELAEQFANHHTAKGTEFANWNAGWRTWIANDIRYRGDPRTRRSGAPAHHGGNGRGNGSQRSDPLADYRDLVDER